tara:strand:+ start:3127 stop:3600 length:474 start_codon:yes stop_codon:yes gene_type:complete
MLKKRKRTDKSRYQHQTTGDHCTCAAYIAEMMCLRNAENKNVGSLPYKFWNKKPWDWTFKRQLIAANKILKDCPEEVLVKAVGSPEFKRIFSLNSPRAKTIVNKYRSQYIIDQETKKDKVNKNLDIKKEATTRKKSYGKKSKFDKLRSIERGEEEVE